jgi:hypothetical protein
MMWSFWDEIELSSRVMCAMHLESIIALRVYPREENVNNGIRISRITNDPAGGILHPGGARAVGR